MGADADLASILHEIIQFLESLCEIELPLKFQNARENLLQKSRTKLSLSTTNRESLSAGTYLEMNVGTLFPHREEIDIEEYVGVEEQPVNSLATNQDYYESFQELGNTISDRNSKIKGSNRKSSCSKKIDHEDEAEDKLLEIYKTFTPAMTMNKAHKCGSLDHKIEKKSFGFVRGNVRSCWIGLVGNHLLIYTSEKDKQPPEICSIRGYMGRPASNTISKDHEHSKSAFEIFCPGNKTLQFTAKTPKEMEEWLAAISRTSLTVPDRDSGMYERSMDEKVDSEHPEEAAPIEGGYQDVGGLIPSPKRQDPVVLRVPSPFLETSNGNAVSRSNSDKKKDIATPPILPIRLPRQLPSLPNEEALMTSYEPLDDGYEEDDIYHKIEDLRDNRRSYENVKKKIIKRGKEKKSGKKKEEKKKKKTEETPELEDYDDVDNKNVESKKEEIKKQRKSLLKDSPRAKSDILETYDDVQTISQENQTSVLLVAKSCQKDLSKNFEASEKRFRTSLTYNDIFQPPLINSVDLNRKVENVESAETKDTAVSSPTKSPTKSPQKRWFLVRNKKESTKKEDKKKENSFRGGKKHEKKEKSRGNAETPQTSGSAVELELPTYDDVSAYQNDLNSLNANQTENTDSNYNSPPRPRPIYIRPPNPISVSSVKPTVEIIEDFYDDIANYRDNNPENSTECQQGVRFFIGKDSEALNNIGTSKNAICPNDNVANSSTRASAIINEENKDINVKICQDTEHYQIPRNDSVKIKSCDILAREKEEELYDDVAILAEFKSKPRNSVSFNYDIPSFSTNEKLTIGIKKPWNRFGNGRKLSAREISIAEPPTVKNKSCPHLDQASDSSTDKTDPNKPNKFQKLINKMESTLGKQTSGKSGISISNKTLNSE